jgi:3-isopropylmalate/(R)-2-methylmalate dehydratase small subunit
MKLRGRAWLAGDLPATAIIPGRYDFFGVTDFREAASHLLEDVQPDFAARVRPGDLVVCSSVGSGHAHYHQQAYSALLAAGVAAVLAERVDAVFATGAINAGLLVWRCPGVTAFLDSGDMVEVDPVSGVGSNITRAADFAVPPVPDVIRRIIESGGLEAATLRELGITD